MFLFVDTFVQFRIIISGKSVLILVITSAHTLARSLHDVSCANNNRFAVVVCFRLTFHASGMRFFLEIFMFKILKIFLPL